MNNKNFIPADIEIRVQKTSYMEHQLEGFCNFEVHDVNCSKSIEDFHAAYVESRKKLFKDMNYGPWKEDSDFGYQKFLEVLESGKYKLGYYENSFPYRIPAQILCCDEWLELGNFTNTCKCCGADYNGSGQLLACRSQWGEETGESWSECY